MTCPDDDALLPILSGEPADAAVRAHYADCPSCRQRVRRMQAEVSSLRGLLADRETVTAPAPPPEAPARPAVIGKYFLVGTLGQGAQAVVYRGLHGTLNKEVVLKVSREPASPAASAPGHLAHEGQVLARLMHPNLAKVYDLDYHEGRPYLVMEYVRGEDLERYAQKVRPTPRQAALLVARLARALAAAHAQGVVHHDVKPRNVIVGEGGEPHLIDFGLAWLRQGRPEGVAPGGTLPYMAPEQARGEAEKVGPRSDLFGLGAVLYFLLTGSPPFEGDDPVGVRQKAMQCELDRSALRKARVPRRLEVICLKALSADPARRHASADELADELEAFARRDAQRPFRLAALAAALLVACGLAWAAWRGRGDTGHVGTEPPEKQGEQAVPAEVAGPQLIVQRYWRKGKEKAYPGRQLLKTRGLGAGDKVLLECKVPAGGRSALFWLDTRGGLHEMTGATRVHQERWDVLRYPRTGGVEVEGPPGTEFLLVVADPQGGAGPSLAGVRAALEGAGALPAGGAKWWPALPEGTFFLLSRGEVGWELAEGERGPGREVPRPEAEVRNVLEKLRDRLRERYAYFWGVALPHL